MTVGALERGRRRTRGRERENIGVGGETRERERIEKFFRMRGNNLGI